MSTFTIGDTEFGVDLEESERSIDTTQPNVIELMLEVYGDQERFDAITDDDESEWSWALYPPHFYLRGLTVPSSTVNDFVELPKPDDNDEIEAAIYIMEHNPVYDLRILIVPHSHVETLGMVEVMGRPQRFHLKSEMNLVA